MEDLKRKGSLSPEMGREVAQLREDAQLKGELLARLLQRTCQIEGMLAVVRQKCTVERQAASHMAVVSESMSQQIDHWERLISATQTTREELHQLQE